MKKLLLILPWFVGVSLSAQTAATTTTFLPNVPFASQPGFTNLLGPFLTNGLGNGLAVADLSPMLANLENNLLQILPVLTALNDSFDLVPAAGIGGTNGTSASLGITTTAPSSGNGNFSGLASTSLASAQGTSLGQDLSGIIGGRGTALTPGNPALTTTTGANVATVNSTTGMNGLAAAGAFAGLFGTNTFGFTNTRDALRALLVLQADVERMLPIVDALNGANLSTLNTTNGLISNPTLGRTSSNSALTPTGR